MHPTTCSRCLASKPLDEFAWKLKARGRRDSWCRACRAVYSREYYLANQARYVALDAERKRKARIARTKLLIAYFADNPCVDCGEDDPVVLEFDHLRDKEFNVGSKLVNCSWRRCLPRSRNARWSAPTATAAAPADAEAQSARC